MKKNSKQKKQKKNLTEPTEEKKVKKIYVLIYNLWIYGIMALYKFKYYNYIYS